MKQLIIITLIFLVGQVKASGQTYYTEATNSDMLHQANRTGASTRVEFILPDSIGGYIPLKADLHLHTYFSDGHLSPSARVREAWLDGLDAISVTDHIEYHPADTDMIGYLGATLPDGIEAHNVNKKTNVKPKQDLNKSVELSKKAAVSYGLLIIPGTEITREPKGIGHYNALFTTDNNGIYDPNPLTAIRNAKAQGALVMHNHPGWRRESIQHPDFELKAYGEGLIDGIEANNGTAFCPGTIDRAKEDNLFVASTTDLHDTSFEEYIGRGLRRDMTIILAKDRSLDAIRDALENRRTIGYGAGGTLMGQEYLLRQLFMSCVSISPVNGHNIQLKNPTSLRFIIHPDGKNPIVLPEFSSIILSDKDRGFSVDNAWTGADSFLRISL